MRRFDPDTVLNSHIYSSRKGEEIFIYIYGFISTVMDEMSLEV